MSATDEFQCALEKLEESYREGLHAFVAYVSTEWRCLSKSAWEKNFNEPYPGQLYEDGYNAAIEGLSEALDYFLEEMT